MAISKGFKCELSKDKHYIKYYCGRELSLKTNDIIIRKKIYFEVHTKKLIKYVFLKQFSVIPCYCFYINLNFK